MVWALACFFKRKQHADINIDDEIVTSFEESWFVYSPAKKDEVDKYISSRWVLFLNLSGLFVWFQILYMILKNLMLYILSMNMKVNS